MVSFSCDDCQNVFTKPKVERHLYNCSTSTVSCIDCGTVFDRRTVRAHTSCIIEAEKYGPHRTKSDSTFCVTCQLQLNGAVHAEQHYNSKKHRANLRKAKQREIPTSSRAQTIKEVSPNGKDVPKESRLILEVVQPITASSDHFDGKINNQKEKTKRSSHPETTKANVKADSENDVYRNNFV